MLEMVLTAGTLVAAVAAMRFAIAHLGFWNAASAALAFELKKT